MRRNQSVLAPVATVNTLVEELVQTDWTVEDGELCFLRSTRQLFEFRKGVTSPAANGITTIQVVSPGVVGQWALLADSDQNIVYFSPQGGGADDWPALNALMASAAGKQKIVFAAGTYTAIAKGVVPNGTHLILGPGVTVLANQDVVSRILFSAASVDGSFSALLTTAAAVGDKTLAMDHKPTAGTVLCARTTSGVKMVRFLATVVSASGASSPYTVTLDRAVAVALPTAGVEVVDLVSHPQDITIEGDDSLISGAAARYFEIVDGERITLRNLRLGTVASHAGEVGAMFMGGADILCEDVQLDSVVGGGLVSWSVNRTTYRYCRAFNVSAGGGLVQDDCMEPKMFGCHAENCASGLLWSGNDAVAGGDVDGNMVACVAVNNTANIIVNGQARRCKITDCAIQGGTYGAFTQAVNPYTSHPQDTIWTNVSITGISALTNAWNVDSDPALTGTRAVNVLKDSVPIPSTTRGGTYSERANATGVEQWIGATPTTVNNAATVALGTDNAVGLLVVSDNGGTCALVFLEGANHAVTIVNGLGGIYTAISGNPGTLNVYWDAGSSRYLLQNNRLSPGIFRMYLIGTAG